MKIQTRFGNKAKEPWQDICCEACWNAREKKCTCHCGGIYHGEGLKREENYGDKIIADGLVQHYLEQISDFRCRWCGADMKGESVHGYEHVGGWVVHGYDEKQWLYIVCPKCHYQWALWKLGVTR